MTLEIKNTSLLEINFSILLYGAAKSGKTRSIRTAPSPIVASSDSGLSSLRDSNIPYCEINTMEDFEEFIGYCKTPQWQQTYKSIFLDDLTELAEMFLAKVKPTHKNKLQAYGELEERLCAAIREFRTLPYYNVMICKQERVQDQTTGGFYQAPKIPGKAIGPQLPYLVSEVWHMEQYIDAEGQKHDVVRTKRTELIEAGSRCGKLGEIEYADLSSIFQKMVTPAA